MPKKHCLITQNRFWPFFGILYGFLGGPQNYVFWLFKSVFWQFLCEKNGRKSRYPARRLVEFCSKKNRINICQFFGPTPTGRIRTIKYCLVSVCLSLCLARNHFSRKPHIGFPWFFAWMLVLGSVKKWRFCFFQENSKIGHFGPRLSKILAKMVQNAQNQRFSAFFENRILDCLNFFHKC